MANVWIIESNRRERGEHGIMVNIPARILHDGCQIATAPSTVTLVGNQRPTTQSLEDVAEDVTRPTVRAEGKDTFAGLAERPVSKEGPYLRNWPSQSHSLAWMENTVVS